jgi:hypothetical protein
MQLTDSRKKRLLSEVPLAVPALDTCTDQGFVNFKEVCKDGSELAGFQNNRRGNSAQKYWKLPVETGEPLEWWPVKAAAGHETGGWP